MNVHVDSKDAWNFPGRDPGQDDPTNPDQDAVLLEALREYRRLTGQGPYVDKSRFLAEYPEVGGELRDGLEGWDILQAISIPAEGLAAAREPLPLGDFRLVREIGRGGMGVVYEAVQLSLGRRVAVKVLGSAGGFDPRRLRRFQVEIHAASLLHHPHIVPVFDVGFDRGLHFYAMHLVDGCGLDTPLRDLREERASGPSSSPERLRDGVANPVETQSWQSTTWGTNLRKQREPTLVAWFLDAAEALEHAHRNGVVHRDIKPSNLLVDRDGHLWVADFGLARCRDGEEVTRTGDILGTLRYLSPEQLRGHRGLVDHRGDIYSLGLTLYELLTLEPAIPGLVGLYPPYISAQLGAWKNNDRHAMKQALANPQEKTPENSGGKRWSKNNIPI